jgi:hypothetical protein
VGARADPRCEAGAPAAAAGVGACLDGAHRRQVAQALAALDAASTVERRHIFADRIRGVRPATPRLPAGPPRLPAAQGPRRAACFEWVCECPAASLQVLALPDDLGVATEACGAAELYLAAVADVADSSGAGREAHLHGDACAPPPGPLAASHGR